jgi:hypothetical protein
MRLFFLNILLEVPELIDDSGVTAPVDGSSNQKSNAQDNADRASDHSEAIFEGQSIDHTSSIAVYKGQEP